MKRQALLASVILSTCLVAPNVALANSGPASSTDWTVLPASAQNIYVAGNGDDVSNNGTITRPFRTVAKALAGLSTPADATIYLKCGYTYPGFDLRVSGASMSAPLVITSWGTGARPRIAVNPNTLACINTSDPNPSNAANHIWLVDLTCFGSNLKDTTGVRMAGYTADDWLIEGCRVKNLSKGMALQATNLRVRRNVITDCDSFGTQGGAGGEGIHIEGPEVAHVLLEENLIVDSGQLHPSIFKHGIYVQADVGSQSGNPDLKVAGNLVGRSASMGIMIRCDATVLENHAFLAGNSGIQYGGLSDEMPMNWPGIYIESSLNVVSELGSGKTCEPLDNGWGFGYRFIRCSKSYRDLVIHAGTGRNLRALDLNASSPNNTVGRLENLSFDQFVAYNTTGVGGGVSCPNIDDMNLVPILSDVTYTTGPVHPLDSCFMLNCKFIAHSNGSANMWGDNSNFVMTSGGAGFVCQGTQFFNSAGLKLQIDGAQQTLGQWNQAYGDMATNMDWVPTDPTRSIATYDLTLGGAGAGTIENFILRMKQQRKGNWDAMVTAPELNAWIRAGF